LSEFEQEVVKISHTCGRFLYVSPALAKKYEDDPESFHCILCTKTDKVLHMQSYTKCHRCNQMVDMRDGGPRGKCMCTESDIEKPHFKFIDSKTKGMRGIKEKESMDILQFNS